MCFRGSWFESRMRHTLPLLRVLCIGGSPDSLLGIATRLQSDVRIRQRQDIISTGFGDTTQNVIFLGRCIGKSFRFHHLGRSYQICSPKRRRTNITRWVIAPKPEEIIQTTG